MSRFYQTAKPAFVDNKIAALPVDLMMAVIESKDTQAKDQEDKIDAFHQTLNALENLTPDDPVIQERIDFYKNRLNKATENIYAGMEDYMKVMPELRNISIQLDKDLNTGTFGLAGKNLSNRNTLIENLKGKEIDQDTRDLILQEMDQQYEGKGGLYDNVTGEYNPYPDDYIIAEAFDVNTDAKNVVANVKKTKTAFAGRDTKTGGIRTGTTERIVLTEEQARDAGENYWNGSTAEEYFTQEANLKFSKEVRQGFQDESNRDEWVREYIDTKKEIFLKNVVANLQQDDMVQTAGLSGGTEADREYARLLESFTDVNRDFDGRDETQRENDAIVESYLSQVYGNLSSKDLAQKARTEISTTYKGNVDAYLMSVYNRIYKDPNTGQYVQGAPPIYNWINQGKQDLREYSVNGYLKNNLTNYIVPIGTATSLEEKEKIKLEEQQRIEHFVTNATGSFRYFYTDNEGKVHTGIASLDEMFPAGVGIVEQGEITETRTLTSEGTTEVPGQERKITKKDKLTTTTPTPTDVPGVNAWKVGLYTPYGDNYKIINVSSDEIYNSGGYDQASEVYMTRLPTNFESAGNETLTNSTIIIFANPQ